MEKRNPQRLYVLDMVDKGFGATLAGSLYTRAALDWAVADKQVEFEAGAARYVLTEEGRRVLGELRRS